MKKPIYIVGAGGLGREVKAMFNTMKDWQVAGFYDDHVPKGTQVDDVVCLGNIETILQIQSTIEVLIAIGDPILKSAISERLSGNRNIQYPVIIHPSALLMDEARISIGAGSIITAGCILTTNIKLGTHTLLNLNVTIGHDTTIGDYCSIMPGANIAGYVQLGKAVLVGSGASVIKQAKIGKSVKIGAGAVVIGDIPDFVTAVGVPARIVKR